MAYYLVKDFIRGLDVRRLQETQEAGALIQADTASSLAGARLSGARALALRYS